MTYNKITHRWTLDLSDAIELYGNISEDYNGEARAKRELEKQSTTIYAWIYSRIPASNRNYVELLIAKNQEVADTFKQVLLAQLEYDLESGGNAARSQLGIDFKTGTQIDRNAMKENMISPYAEALLNSLPSNLNILYAGRWNVYLDENRYATRDY